MKMSGCPPLSQVPVVGCHVQQEQVRKSPPRLVNRPCRDLAVLKNFSQIAALSEVASEHRLRVSIGFESEKAIAILSGYYPLHPQSRSLSALLRAAGISRPLPQARRNNARRRRCNVGSVGAGSKPANRQAPHDRENFPIGNALTSKQVSEFRMNVRATAVRFSPWAPQEGVCAAPGRAANLALRNSCDAIRGSRCDMRGAI